MRKNLKLAGALAVAGLVAAGGSAFTASNTIAPSVLGSGSASVSGATVTSTGYTLDATDTNVTAVHFVVAALPTTAVGEVKLTGANTLDTGYQSCVTTDATHLDCTLTGVVPIADVNNLGLVVH